MEFHFKNSHMVYDVQATARVAALDGIDGSERAIRLKGSQRVREVENRFLGGPKSAPRILEVEKWSPWLPQVSHMGSQVRCHL